MRIFRNLDTIREPELAPKYSLVNPEILSSGLVDNSIGAGPAGNRTPETLVLTQNSYHTGPSTPLMYQISGNKSNTLFGNSVIGHLLG